MAAIAKLLGSIIALIFLAYIAFFAIANNSVTPLSLWPQTQPIEAPIWLIALCAFSAGLLFIASLASIRISALRLALYRAEKKLNDKKHNKAETAQQADQTSAQSSLAYKR